MKKQNSPDDEEVTLTFQLDRDHVTRFYEMGIHYDYDFGTCENFILTYVGPRSKLPQLITGPWEGIFKISELGYPTPKVWIARDKRYRWFETYFQYLLQRADWATYAKEYFDTTHIPDRFVTQKRIFQMFKENPLSMETDTFMDHGEDPDIYQSVIDFIRRK
mgnify:CR=1 FL=1